MLKIINNVTPTIEIKLNDKNGIVMIQTILNISKSELESLFQMFSSENSEDWSKSKEIKRILDFLSDEYEINDFSDYTLEVNFDNDYIASSIGVTNNSNEKDEAVFW